MTAGMDYDGMYPGTHMNNDLPLPQLPKIQAQEDNIQTTRPGSYGGITPKMKFQPGEAVSSNLCMPCLGYSIKQEWETTEQSQNRNTGNSTVIQHGEHVK